MKKLIVFKILSYVLFLGMVSFGMFYAIKKARDYRNMDYYNSVVFKHYITADAESPTGYEDDLYFRDTITAFSCYYAKDPLYRYESELDNPMSNFDIRLSIYKIADKKHKYQGFALHIDKLSLYFEDSDSTKTGRYDLMGRNRLTPAQSEYNPRFRLNIEFDYKNPEFKKERDKIATFEKLDPYKPLVFHEPFLFQKTKSGIKYPDNTVTGIKIWVADTVDSEENKVPSRTLLVLASPESSFTEEVSELKKTDLDLSKEKYQLNHTKKPTAKQIEDENLVYHSFNYKGYNRGIILTSIIGILLVLVVAYFIFLHKKFVAYVKDKNREKRKENRIANQIEDHNTDDSEKPL